MKKNSFVEGTIAAYIAILLTKILGAVYVIPFYKIIGSSGGVLYSYAYNVYNLFLEISTSGIPTAISIIVAEYNTLKMFNEREFTYKIANRIIALISFIAFLIMFVFAGNIANFFIGDIEGGHSIESVKLVIRIISFCLLVVPFLSVTRGYLQGNKYVATSSSSQLIEQLARIIILLVGSYVAINVLHYSIPIGVSVALSGTVLGALCALLFLKWKIHKNKEELNKDVTSYKDSKVSSKEIIKKIITFAIPIIVISVTQNIYNTTDLKLIIKGLYLIGYDGEKCELIASVITTWAPKICMVINALATGLCASIIPFIVSSYVNNDKEELNNKFNQAINTIIYITVPLAAFIILLSKPIYYIFYGNNEYGFISLKLLSIVSIFFTTQLVINMMLQGMKKFKIVYINTIVGIVVNILLDIPMIIFLNKLNFYPYLGTILATIIGQIISISIVVISMKKNFKFSYKSIRSILLKIFIPIFIMCIAIVLLSKVFFNTDNYITTFIQLAITGIVGLLIYFGITFKTGVVSKIFGEDAINSILIKLKIKKETH